jgi:hypothetical protein
MGNAKPPDIERFRIVIVVSMDFLGATHLAYPTLQFPFFDRSRYTISGASGVAALETSLHHRHHRSPFIE